MIVLGSLLSAAVFAGVVFWNAAVEPQVPCVRTGSDNGARPTPPWRRESAVTQAVDTVKGNF